MDVIEKEINEEETQEIKEVIEEIKKGKEFTNEQKLEYVRKNIKTVNNYIHKIEVHTGMPVDFDVERDYEWLFEIVFCEWDFYYTFQKRKGKYTPVPISNNKAVYKIISDSPGEILSKQEESLIEEKALEVISQLIDTLPDIQRILIRIRYYTDSKRLVKLKFIASKEGKSMQTIDKSINRGIRKLKMKIDNSNLEADFEYVIEIIKSKEKE